MTTFRFSIQGIGAEITAIEPARTPTFRELAEDFRELSAASDCEVKVRMDFVPATPMQKSGKKLPLCLWRTKQRAVHGLGRTRVCVYPGAGLIEAKTSAGVRHFYVAETSPGALREAAYKALLSAIGEELDRRGFHRVHAFGWEANGRRHLFLAPSGGGKSALATLLTRGSDPVRIFSDENPLLRNGIIFPYPLRLALAPNVAEALGAGHGRSYVRADLGQKVLFPFPSSLLAEQGKVDVLCIGRTGAKEPRISKLSRTRASVELFFAVVVGLGLAQMGEWMLRPQAIPSLIAIAASRGLTLLKLLFSVEEVYRFDLSSDAMANAEFVRERFAIAIPPNREWDYSAAGSGGRGSEGSSSVVPGSQTGGGAELPYNQSCGP